MTVDIENVVGIVRFVLIPRTVEGRIFVLSIAIFKGRQLAVTGGIRMRKSILLSLYPQ